MRLNRRWTLPAFPMLLVLSCGLSACSQTGPDAKTQSSQTASQAAAAAPASQAPASQPPASASDPDAEDAADLPQAGSPPAFEFVAPPLSSQEVRDGWVSLFDGISLFGWKPNSETDWSVQNGVIMADGEVPGLLLTPFRVADFELRCDFQLEPGGNSGIFLRTPMNPGNPAEDCYELNICDTHDSYPTASFVGRKRVEMNLQTDGSWHTMFVRAVGPRLIVKLDEQLVLDWTDDSAHQVKAGHIGLQMNGGRIQFRNVCLRPESLESLLDADLSQWHRVPGSEGKFEMEDETLKVSGGPGFLESGERYGDFVLQLEARTGAPDVNSGVFFRAMTGTAEAPSNGYELQICNQIADGDRTRPNEYGTGFGTGAIFRRMKARWVVPDDLKWFTMTLIADGDQFSSWVDGYPVVSWQDSREPDENPRRGRRLEPGHLILQAHDSGTRIDFRNLRIGTLP